eukprot:TRINITY_DN2653_c0_g1_i1.p1 TRINITY_DN2653_c0_g1~~TRINITY_DN2653_c0_g1_i1.p1  ORF type:complete len:408 (+),score=105.61 TRINITY_DN2653_c0_g1_i1:48-1226(+)
MRYLIYMLFVLVVMEFGFIRMRMVDTHRLDVLKIENELILWKQTARSFLDNEPQTLKKIRGGVVSPLHGAFVARLLQESEGRGEGVHGARVLGEADKELLEEEEKKEEKDDDLEEDEWPPPGNWGDNTDHKLFSGNTLDDLPKWDGDVRFSDIKNYYTSLDPSAGLLKQLQKVIRKVWKNWEKKDIWASYPSEDIHDCETLTPECLFWSNSAVNRTIPDSNATNSNKNFRKCCIEHRKMRAVTQNTFNVLYKAGIPMWLGDGTLLGTRRGHGTVIPWDTDIDVFAKKEDKARIITALKEGVHSGDLPHAWEKDRHGRNMFWVYYSKKKMAGDSHLEIWLTDGKKEKRNNFDLVFPLQPCPFYDFTVLCPQKVNAILTIAYGHWRTPDKEKKV